MDRGYECGTQETHHVALSGLAVKELAGLGHGHANELTLAVATSLATLATCTCTAACKHLQGLHGRRRAHGI